MSQPLGIAEVVTALRQRQRQLKRQVRDDLSSGVEVDFKSDLRVRAILAIGEYLSIEGEIIGL